MESLNNEISIMRHLDDIDNLLEFGRDGDLLPGQEAQALNIARDILAEIKSQNKDAVLFICSSKKRGVQTAELIANEIKNEDPDLKIRIAPEEELASLYQGEFILPADYKPGDSFEGLPLANKAFVEETYNKSTPNFLYRFGDPLLQADGSYKYPDLAKFFSKPGENNRDFLVRIYELIIKTQEKLTKFDSRTKAVIVTHSQLYQIFKDLSILGQKIREGLVVETGSLPKLCWEQYSERFRSEKPTYNINFIPLDVLEDKRVISVLKNEFNFLNSIK